MLVLARLAELFRLPLFMRKTLWQLGMTVQMLVIVIPPKTSVLSSTHLSNLQSSGPAMAHKLLDQAAKLEVSGPRRVRAEPKEEGEAPCEDFNISEPRSPEDSWRRVLLRVLLLQAAARWQVVLSEVSTLAPFRDRKRGYQEEDFVPMGHAAIVWVEREDILARQPLTMSKSLRQLAPESACHHPGFHTRGGKTLWFTCTRCPMRWPRHPNERLQSP